MVNYYLSILLLSASFPAFSQIVATGSPAPLDTLRPPFRGNLSDSLAPVPTALGTWHVQGQAQPTRPFLTVQDQLRTVAGVQVTPYDGSPGSGQAVRIRGASELRLSGQPLYIVDGLPALNDELTSNRFLPAARSYYSPEGSVAQQQAETGANPLQLLPPEAIEHIEVLAGPAAVARYGPLGANGVISIRTRRAGGTTAQPLRVRYAAYAGVQQVRQRYDLLGASEYAAIANEAYRNQSGDPSTVPFPSTQLGEGTDWQAAAYRVAGLQQHHLSLEGRTPRTGYLISADYRQQSGVLRGSNLSRYGLRVAFDQHPSARLGLRATVDLGQTDQRLPLVAGPYDATRAALFARPTASVRTAQGTYSGYDNTYSQFPSYFSNPLAVSDYSYRSPRTRRLLSQLAADYQPAPGLTVQAAVSLQLTQLDAPNFSPRQYINFGPPDQSEQSGNQTYENNQLAARLAVHYERRLGQHHRLGAEIDYQYQQNNYHTDTELTTRLYDKASGVLKTGSYSISFISGRPRLHRPWARVHYALDSTLEAEVGFSYARFKGGNKTEYYPSGQLSWHPRLMGVGANKPLALWVGAARTSLLGFGFGMFGPAQLTSQNTSLGYGYRSQSPLHTDQLEAGLRLGQPTGRLVAQLVAYERRSQHALLATQVALPSATGYISAFFFDEGTIRNQGLELTVATSWQAGRVQGTTRLVASANRNRLQGDEYAVQHNAEFDNHPVSAFYGYQQDGLTANGSVRYRDLNGDGQVNYLDQQYLGSGTPAQLASLSQQVRLGRLALDAQLDGQFSYQVLNHQLTVLDAPTGIANSATSVRDYWTPTKPTTSVPAPGRVSAYNLELARLSNRQLENGSHVRLSSLTATYRLRQLASQDLSVWAGVQNLFVLSGYRGYDPNVSSGGSSGGLAGQDYGAVPVPRTWLAGVRLAL
jgi:hypothetical protein